MEDQWVNLHTKSRHILLLKLTSQMALGEELVKIQDGKINVTLTKVVLPVPPSPTRTNLKVGMSSPVAILLLLSCQRCNSAMEGSTDQGNDGNFQSEMMAFHNHL